MCKLQRKKVLFSACLSCLVMVIFFDFAMGQKKQAGQKKPVDFMNVFTGTSNSRWQMFPGSCLPFSMVKLSPDNQGNVWNGGYEYSISSISGFSHLHPMGLIWHTKRSCFNSAWIFHKEIAAGGTLEYVWVRNRIKTGDPCYHRKVIDALLRIILHS